MTTHEYNEITKGLIELKASLINSFDRAIDKFKGINSNECPKHLKVDCMCDEPHE